MIIDVRIRVPYKSFTLSQLHDNAYSSAFASMFGSTQAASSREKSMELVLEEIKEAEIDYAFVPGRRGGDWYPISNDDLIALKEEYPNKFDVLASVSMDESIEKNLEDIKIYALEKGAAGIALESGIALKNNCRFVDDEYLWPIYEMCESNDIPVALTHSGPAYPNMTGTHGFRLQNISRDFPKLKLLIMHGGWPNVADMVCSVFTNKNIYLSPDFYLVHAAGWQGYVDAANYMIPNNIVYGSAYPLASIKDVLDFYRFKAGFKPDVLQKVLCDNAARFFNLDLDKISK